VWKLLTNRACRKAVLVAERYADGASDAAQLSEAFTNASDYAEELGRSAEASGYEGPLQELELAQAAALAAVEGIDTEAEYASDAVAWVKAKAVWYRLPADRQTDEALEVLKADQDAVHCDILRDIFPPWWLARLGEAELAWKDATVLRLAAASYEHRTLPSGHLDGSRLAVLADALEDAGCTDAELLAHLRSPGPHVRGCEAVDAILGKS
jgi:hypothetical protein